MYGYLPVLAHVERYECLFRNYEGIYGMIQLGAYMQMNISSINNRINRNSRFCIKLIENGLVHLLGTDSHSDNGRTPEMRKGVELLQRKYGNELVDQLLINNTRKLLKNEYI
jgi:protein-tyrosine phosphatase